MKHIQASAPWHPKASASGCVYQHILIAEKALGRWLPNGAEVHHVDGNKRNNANRNLVICQNKAYHKLLHVRTRIVRAGGNPNTEALCSRCKRVRPLDAFNRRSGSTGYGLQQMCRECQHAYQKTYERPSGRAR